MAQPQQHYQAPQAPSRPYSPQDSPSLPAQYGMPPNKRQRLSPNPPSQPGSPYTQSPYGINTNMTTPASAGASPHFQNVHLPNGAYNTPYSNGHTTPTLSLPQSQPIHQSQPLQAPLNFHHNAHNQAPNFNNYSMAPQGAGTMGPPSKPIEKGKENEDYNDIMAVAGVNLAEEEQYSLQIYNNSFNSQLSGSQSGTISSGNSFTQFPPGDERSFYGAGPANATGEKTNPKSQDEYNKKVADKAWHDAARALAVSRQKELDNPFLQVGLVQTKAAKTARDHGLSLNIDYKQQMGTMKLPEYFVDRKINVQTVVGTDAAYTVTYGNFLPHDSMLVDQLALLSIATKHRLRGLIEDAVKLAKGRQTGSHGAIPEEWADAAALSNPDSSSVVAEGAPRSGWESAVSPHSNPLKRSFSSANRIPTPISDPGKASVSDTKAAKSDVVAALRSTANKERNSEETRLRKRMARASGEGTPRQGSVIPGTPGSIAPEYAEKAPTKKEQKKKAEAKFNEAASHAAANATTTKFLGGGGGIFGKSKKYSWMTGGAGGSASGTSTPGRITTLPSTPSGAVGNVAPAALTAEGARRLGTWREDGDKGQDIQIRDWVAVLEEDGREKKALQKAYMFLDVSDPK